MLEYQDVLTRLGSVVRIHRQNAKLSVAKLSDTVKCSSTTLEKLEKLQELPDLLTAVSLCRQLEIPGDEAFDLPQPVPEEEDFLLRLLHDRVDYLSPRLRVHLLNYLDVIGSL